MWILRVNVTGIICSEKQSLTNEDVEILRQRESGYVPEHCGPNGCEMKYKKNPLDYQLNGSTTT